MYSSAPDQGVGFGLLTMYFVEEMFFFYVSRMLFRLHKNLLILGQTGILYK